MATTTMMLNTALARAGVRRVATVGVRRHASTSPIPADALRSWYNVFGKSTAAYGAWIVVGVLVTESITGWGARALWRSANYGKTFDTVDWTKFKTEDEDEEEGDEEEEEEEEEEDADDDE